MTDNYVQEKIDKRGKCHDCTGRHCSTENYLYRCGDCDYMKERAKLAMEEPHE